MKLAAILLLCVAAATTVAASKYQMPNFNRIFPATVDGKENPICGRPGFRTVDISQHYMAAHGGMKKVCAMEYVDVCYGINGAIACNEANSKCVDDAKKFNSTITQMVTRPQVCVSAGEYWHPETGIMSTAQPVVAFTVILTYFCLVAVAVKEYNVSPAALTLACLQLIFCIVLLFSFYYLNAYIAMAATISALALYATRCRVGVVVGMVILLAALMWLSHGPGLGYLQHQFRLGKCSPSNPTGITMTPTHQLQDMCGRYYNMYFSWPEETKDELDSPLQTTWGYCDREFLAAELAFAILAQLVLILMIAVGPAQLVAHEEAPKQEEVAAPAEEAAAPAEAENIAAAAE